MLARINETFARGIPHNRAMGLQILSISSAECRGRLPYKPELVGNAESGVLHGGAITALIDAVSGGAVFAAMRRTTRVATLDLRIDYLKPASPERDVICEASCYKLTRSVAFTRAIAHHGDASDLIASSAGTFMVMSDPRSGVAEAP